MNIVIISGRLGYDPEEKELPSGAIVVSGSIGVKETVKGDKVTYWVDFDAYGATGELVKRYHKKGDMIGIIGKLVTRTYKDKETGKDRKVWKVTADRIEFYDKNKETKGSNDPADWLDSYASPVSTDVGDLPF